ncbi:MAG: HIRAN domain-containing protein [Bacteroidales bacterium]|nr:HIRAN domain-containing protein [Bacteroidales bacterium]
MNRKSFIQSLLSLFSGFAFLSKIYAADNKSTIYLLTTYVAGYQYYDGETIEKQFKKSAQLKLCLEESNAYDKNAVELYYNDVKIGYIPRMDNEIIANLLRKNKEIYAEIKEFYPHNPEWNRLEINVWMRE